MHTNKKVLSIVFIMLGLLSTAIVINVWIAFEKFGNRTTIERANSIAESVRDGLTAHMTLDAMANSSVFLNNMKKHQNVKTLRIVRSQKIIQEFGKGDLDPYKYDDIEKDVLKNGQTITQQIQDKHNKYLRISIPYIATQYTNPDCLSCHTNVKEGEVLGAISLELDITEIEDVSVDMIHKIIVISSIFFVITFFIATYFIRPYIKLFDDLEDGISKAYKGDFSFSVRTKLKDDAGKVANKLNDLSEIFRFKKTIEHDDTKEKIYERMAHILQSNFLIEEFVIVQHNLSQKTRKVAYRSKQANGLDITQLEDIKKSCRALRTNLQTSSTDFHKICDLCHRNDKESLCLPFAISEELALSLLIYADTKEELFRIKELIPIITNYFELMEPVLQTKLLMERLKEKSLKDPMTGLFNRRFLDHYMTNEIFKHDTFCVLMIDVDFFKKVNDTYGHTIGDEVIKELGKVIRTNIKGSDVASRYGGEEFTVILFDIPIEKSIDVATNIKKDFSKKIFKSENESFSKTLSIGISSFPDISKEPLHAIKDADTALYNAKQTGRNKVVLFESEMVMKERIK